MGVQMRGEGSKLELSLIGEVGFEIDARSIQRELAGRTGDLTVSLFSYGGDAVEGLAIHSLLARHQGKKKVIIDGVAASAASVIAMAGDEIVMPESSFLMIHDAWGFAMGGADDMRQQADLIDRISATYRQTYAKRSGMSEDDVRSLMAAESWLTAAEAVEFGFATEVAPAAEIKAAALPEGRFSKMPRALRERIELIPAVEFEKRRKVAAEAAELVEVEAPAPAAADQGDSEWLDDVIDDLVVGDESRSSEGEENALGSLSADNPAADLPAMTVNTEREAAVQAERDRAKTIRAMCERAGAGFEKAEQMIDDGLTVDQARENLFALVTEKEKREIGGRMQVEGDGLIGMSEKEVRSYSLMRAIRHFCDPSDVNLKAQAGLELEASAAAEKASGRPCQGAFRIPADVLIAQIPGVGSLKNNPGIRADQTAGGFTSGGALIDTNLLLGSMIELVYNRLSITQMGATVLSGLVGDIDIPRETSGPTHYWVGEGAAPDASELAVGQMSLTPKTVGAKTVLTRRFIKQTTISAEAWVRSHLSRKIALGIDYDFIYSPGGSSRPRGLKFTDGIGTQTFDGGTDKTINTVSYDFGTYLQLVEMETKVGLANLDVPSMAYLMNTHARGIYKTTLENTNSDFYIYRNDEVNGYRAMVSNQVQNNNVIFGDFSQVLLAFWSGQDVGVNPFKYQDSGSVEISILQDCDFGVRYPEAFVFGS